LRIAEGGDPRHQRPLNTCGTGLNAQAVAGLRPAVAPEMAHFAWLKWRICQDIVGIRAKVLPLTGRAWRGLTGRAWRGLRDRRAATSSIRIGLETQTSPPERRESRSGWRVNKPIHPKGGNVLRVRSGRSLIISDAPMFCRGLGHSWVGNAWTL
jgi:hypothetical protein